MGWAKTYEQSDQMKMSKNYDLSLNLKVLNLLIFVFSLVNRY